MSMQRILADLKPERARIDQSKHRASYLGLAATHWAARWGREPWVTRLNGVHAGRFIMPA
jgi:hypothetical protein